jgi:glycosyltransferase involved in cell wall biosynthesis
MHVAINAHLLNNELGYRQSGISRYIEKLVPALIRAGGSDVSKWTVFAAPGVPLPSGIPRSANVRLVNSILPTHRPIARIFWEQCIAPFSIVRHRPDILLCPLNVVPLAAACPTVVTVHDLAFMRLKTHRSSRRSYLSYMTRVSVKRSAHIIAVSDFTRNEVIEVLDTPAQRITAIPNGVDRSMVAPDKASLAQWRAKNNLTEEFILFVGTLEPRKNLIGLIEAYAKVRQTRQVPLVVVGAPGWCFTPIYDAVRRLKLEEHVRFEGFVADHDLPFYYAAAAAFVYPSLYEGFGLPPLESMAIGTPVVTSNVASLPEVVGDAALLVPPHSTDALAAAMVRILCDEPLRARLRSAGITQANAFSWETCADAVLNVLKSAVSSKIQKNREIELTVS